MIPVALRTPRLLLNQPTAADLDRIVEYCRDPVFETTMTLPWPYERRHAEFFVERVVPQGWTDDREYTWALRTGAGEPLLGVIGYRAEAHDVGYWLGAPHRGRGFMTEALTAVTDWLFGRGVRRITWECVVGNTASAAVARRAGFGYTGTGPSGVAFRDGSHPPAWHGELLRSGRVETEWPA